MGSSGAWAGWAAALGSSRRSGALEASSMVPMSFKALLGGFMWKRELSGWLEVLPVTGLVANEMSLGVFHLLFMQGFLWNAGIGRTIPKRTSCECSPLIKPHSCTNTLHPAQTASQIWFFEACLCLPPDNSHRHHCGAVRHLEGGQWEAPHTSGPSAAFTVQRGHTGLFLLTELDRTPLTVSIGSCLQRLRSLWDQICQIAAC